MSRQLPPNAYRLPISNQLEGLLTLLRDRNTPRADFILCVLFFYDFLNEIK